jgi:tetratricopeptide (TPR) repeat protein
VSASFHGQVVEERLAPSGQPVRIGDDSRLALPLPAGLPWLARVVWSGPKRCVVEDGHGRQHVLEPDDEVVLEAGPVTLKLFLAEQFPIRRAEGWSLQASLAWFTVVLMATVLSMQGGWWQNPENHCPWAVSVLPTIPDVAEPLLWVVGPVLALALVGAVVLRQAWREAPSWVGACLALMVPLVYTVSGAEYRSGEEVLASSFYYCLPEEQQDNGIGGALSAEYLARLLKEDYDGEEDGQLEHQRDKVVDKVERMYLPAGNKGPVTEMGGAADTSRDPVRTPASEEIPLPKQARDEQVPLYAKDVGEPVPEEELPEEQEEQDGLAELDVPEEPDADEEALDLPAEEEEGWGVQDWYDDQDAAVEALEIEYMIRAARGRLKIDPNDPAALSILSYYQYLAADYDDAIATYDKYIELYPDDAAGYNNKALVYKRRGDYAKEEALYRVALALEPLDFTAMNNLAVNLAHQGRFDEALAVMEQLEALDPGDPYADLHRAKVHAEMGNDDEALRYLEKALEGMKELDTLHHIEFRQDIRIDPSFEKLRQTHRFRAILVRYYGDDSPLQE